MISVSKLDDFLDPKFLCFESPGPERGSAAEDFARGKEKNRTVRGVLVEQGELSSPLKRRLRLSKVKE